MAFPFLTARWSNLFLATYAVPPPLLQERLAPGSNSIPAMGRLS
jgi:hypothetical protein